jgi:flavin reductase (DIM6/NTAB) family NADH-FMN oxidoreductase RutF
VSTSVSAQVFRETLALWPSGVTVLTARGDDGLVGMTISSFSSLSLDPPLILACLDKNATSHDGLVGASGFAVHVLSRDQEGISRGFARRCFPSASRDWCVRTRRPSTAAITRSSSVAWWTWRGATSRR